MALQAMPSSPLSFATTNIKPNGSLNAMTPLSFPHSQLLLPPVTSSVSVKEELALNLKPPPLTIINGQDGHSLVEQSILRNRKYLKELSSWGIGGPCNYFLQVSRTSELIAVIHYCQTRCIPLLIVGKGSNCLFDDHGFDGFVVLNRLDQFEVIEPGVYRVGSGYPFNRLGFRCSIEGFSGLEFAGGIPGTVGGAVFMNAGANGQETGNVIDAVEVVTKEGELRELKRNDIAFGYRWSSFQEMKDLAAIVAVTFRLMPEEKARERQRALLERRRKTQPIGERSAGSVFRNPPDSGISAGGLIELAGLKGFGIGGAKVSTVHANFFINFNGSTSTDMLALINHVKEEVDELFGIELKEEIRYVPHRTLSM
ncbi:uncharacterized protein [Typha latifolia]|uniref:uncharacterized protein n=1 Tax=Typha latifolia TaxID=4733 RepID=UPI003C2E1F12